MTTAELHRTVQSTLAGKRLGAPVRQGDVLFKVARLDRLYIECKVKERDIHEIADKLEVA